VPQARLPRPYDAAAVLTALRALVAAPGRAR
jgi:hypothetical protein